MAKTASEILIERFLKDVDEKGTMPWQRPYECYNAFNYFSLQPYRGFNRIFLPFGEYLTARQLITYNNEHGEDFKFQKGIKWYPICFFKLDKKECSYEEVMSKLPDADTSKDGYLGHRGVWAYSLVKGTFYKQRNILRYYEVADRHHFKNSKGELLPSRLDTGEVEITKSKPLEVFNSYVEKSGIKVQNDVVDVPCYIPSLDLVQLNPMSRDEDSWFSTAFHEFAHSTGHRNRLNRVGVTRKDVAPKDVKSVYAVEECIAEIASFLCCAECGIHDFSTSETARYDNNVAYVQYWKERIKDFGKEFFYICSQADKAFNYIMDFNEEEFVDE